MVRPGKDSYEMQWTDLGWQGRTRGKKNLQCVSSGLPRDRNWRTQLHVIWLIRSAAILGLVGDRFADADPGCGDVSWSLT